ncbi:MAG: hypothetical protein U1F77_10655 [Kiritimatiellia bacterium]
MKTPAPSPHEGEVNRVKPAARGRKSKSSKPAAKGVPAKPRPAYDRRKLAGVCTDDMKPCHAFHCLREAMGWTRQETASILGLSRKAVESYELAWRKVPDRVWKQALTVAAIQRKYPLGTQPCWELTHCRDEVRESCLCRKLTDGRFCWMTVTKCCRLSLRGEEMGFKQCLSCPVVRQFVQVGAGPAPQSPTGEGATTPAEIAG